MYVWSYQNINYRTDRKICRSSECKQERGVSSRIGCSVFAVHFQTTVGTVRVNKWSLFLIRAIFRPKSVVRYKIGGGTTEV